MNIIIIVLSAVTGLFGLYTLAIACLGAFRPPRLHEQAPPKYRLAALIAARNEEAVIGDLVESLISQRYPRELFDVIVVPNNCDDDTASAAERAGARILECTVPVKTKGEALRFAFDRLLDENQYDAFVIFDADNLAHSGFFQAVNNALSSGARIAQGYRDSKNADANWIAGDISIFYWGMSRLFNRARNRIGMASALNGTGFMVAASLLREIDYHFETLTEDLELTAKCALHGEKVGWMQDAITYDEQPEGFAESFIQRRRWFAGTFQCFKKFGWRLIKRSVSAKSMACFDCFVVFSGTIVQLLCLVPPILMLVRYGLFAGSDPSRWMALIKTGAVFALAGILGTVGLAALICGLERRLNRKRIGALAGFPVFAVTWMAANIVCLFTPPPKWKPIRHRGSAGQNLPM